MQRMDGCFLQSRSCTAIFFWALLRRRRGGECFKKVPELSPVVKKVKRFKWWNFRMVLFSLSWNRVHSAHLNFYELLFGADKFTGLFENRPLASKALLGKFFIGVLGKKKYKIRIRRMLPNEILMWLINPSCGNAQINKIKANMDSISL